VAASLLVKFRIHQKFLQIFFFNNPIVLYGRETPPGKALAPRGAAAFQKKHAFSAPAESKAAGIFEFPLNTDKSSSPPSG
jgi:hypothetical protein